MIDRIREWAKHVEGLHVVVLVGSRARMGATPDELSDHDLVLFCDDPEQFSRSDAWISGLGDPLIILPESTDLLGSTVPTRLVEYREGHRVDFTLSSRSALRVISYLPELPPMFDLGYRVLWDPEGATGPMCPPQGRGYAGRVPEPDEILADVREFFWETLVVGKALARGEAHAAAYSAESVMRHGLLRRILEVRARMATGWSGHVGPTGRGLSRFLPDGLREDAAPRAADWNDSGAWQELDELFGCFVRVAREVCAGIGVEYPEVLEREVTERLQRIRAARL